MTFVGEQKFITTATLQGRSARNPPQDISQAILLNSVTLQNTEVKYPPSVLASLPLLIQNPEGLKYNRGIPATKETIMAMLDLTYYDPPVTLDFILPDGSEVTKTFAACTPTIEIGEELLGERKLDLSCVSLVRKYNDNEYLRIPCCYMPIGVFYIPDTKWTFELRCLPNALKATKENVQMLLLFLEQRLKEFQPEKGVKEQVFTFLNSFLQPNIVLTEKDDEKLGLMLEDMNALPKYEGFRAKTFRTGEINITRFTVEKDGRLRTKRNSQPNAYYNATDVVVHKTKNGWDMQYGEKVFYVPLEKIPEFFEFINLSMVPIWESIPKRSFTFESPERPENNPEIIPRAYQDSRINHIKPEYLQRVIEEQLQFAKKFGK